MKISSYPIVAAVLLIGASWLFFYRIGQHSLWTDELSTAELVAHQTQSQVWNPTHSGLESRSVYGCLVPYFSIVKAWCSVFGNTEKGLRSLSAFSAWTALALILLWGPHGWGIGRRAAAAAGALFALSPMMLWYAQEARYYALLQPFALLTVGLYHQYWKSRQGVWLAAWTACAIISIMIHSFMIFGIVAISCYGLWRWRQNRFANPLGLMVSHGLVAAYFLWCLKVLSVSYDRISTVDRANYTLKTDEYMPWKILANFLCGVWEHPVIPCTLLTVTAIILLALHGRETLASARTISPAPAPAEESVPSLLWLIAALGAVALMISVSWFRPIMVEGKRYVMVFFAPFCVCLGCALASRSVPRLGLLLFMGILSLNALMVDWFYFNEPQKQNWRLAGVIIRETSQKGDAWIHQNEPRAFAAEYYGGGSASRAKSVIWEPPQIAGNLPADLQNAKRIWLVKTGDIADAYAERLQKEGFRLANGWKLPSGPHFATHLWLFEKTPVEPKPPPVSQKPALPAPPPAKNPVKRAR